MELLLMLVGALLVAATVLPLWRHQGWWVRVFDFPRLQIAAGLLLVAAAHALIVDGGFGAYAFRAALMLCLALQLWRMAPYTRLVPRQVQDSPAPPARNGIRLMFANVLQTNRNAQRLLELTRENDPDVILALETDAWWARALSGLATTHPHQVLRPQDNTYGMVLYSRLELVDPQVCFLVEPDVPSIHTGVRLRSGREVRLHCLHPRPPAPQESQGSVERDAELLIVGRSVKAHPGPVVVMGDMNDVAWSHTSTLFRRISGLLDPRIGRGFFNTFSATNPLLRFPLDHFFHSNDFRLIEFRRLAHIGSDHFPIYIHLNHEPPAEHEQPEPQAGRTDHEEAQERIEEASPRAAPGRAGSSASTEPHGKTGHLHAM